MVLLWETETLEVGWVVLEQYLSLFNFSTVEKKKKQQPYKALNIIWLYSQKGQQCHIKETHSAHLNSILFR